MEVNENVKSIQYIPAGIAVKQKTVLLSDYLMLQRVNPRNPSNPRKSAIQKNNPRFRQKTPNLQPINQKFPTKTIDNSPQVVIYFGCIKFLALGVPFPFCRRRFQPRYRSSDSTRGCLKIRVIRVIRENPRFRQESAQSAIQTTEVIRDSDKNPRKIRDNPRFVAYAPKFGFPHAAKFVFALQLRPAF